MELPSSTAFAIAIAAVVASGMYLHLYFQSRVKYCGTILPPRCVQMAHDIFATNSSKRQEWVVHFCYLQEEVSAHRYFFGNRSYGHMVGKASGDIHASNSRRSRKSYDTIQNSRVLLYPFRCQHLVNGVAHPASRG